jgi:hypothetical protein
MAASILNSFQPDALEANRRGELTERQRQGFTALARYSRRNAFSIAAFLVAGGALVGFFASPDAPVTARVLITSIAFTIAAFLVVRAIVGADALTRDLRESRVESAEGPIGKRHFSGSGGQSGTHFLDVGDRSFKVSLATYQTAPDMGIVRLYYLPRSRKIVNLERMAGPPVPETLTAKGIIDTLGAAFAAPTRSQRNEARAEIAGIGDALKASLSSSTTAAPARAGDSRPLAQAIVGMWSNKLMQVTFSADGRVTGRMLLLGMTREGHWSIDRAGRLCADITGRQETTDASVDGDQLTISIDDQAMTFTRDS